MNAAAKSLPDADRHLIARIRAMLREAAVPENAGPMQSYMKSEMPFIGVAQPVHRTGVKRLVRETPPPGPEVWQDTVLALWREARHREERYCAIHLARHRVADAWQKLAILPLYEELVVTGAWWDLVDAIAPYRFPDLLAAAPSGMSRTKAMSSETQRVKTTPSGSRNSTTATLSRRPSATGRSSANATPKASAPTRRCAGGR